MFGLILVHSMITFTYSQKSDSGYLEFISYLIPNGINKINKDNTFLGSNQL